MPMSGRLILKCDVVYSRCLCDESSGKRMVVKACLCPSLACSPPLWRH